MAPHVTSMGPRVHATSCSFAVWLFTCVVTLSALAGAQEQTIARLTRDNAAEISRVGGNAQTTPGQSTPTPRSSSAASSTLARSAADALFVRSDLRHARLAAAQALRRNPKDAEALFVRMETAAMYDDPATMLDAAIRLCQVAEASPNDPRVQLAAVRVREAAANTTEFRAVLLRIKNLLASSQQEWPELRQALLLAAMDGTPGLDPYAIARGAGILTDWRIVGPLGRQPLGGDAAISLAEDLSKPSYQNRAVENFQFPSGDITLPDYLAHRGMFYAAAHFASLTDGSWQVSVSGSGSAEVYVDGRRVLRTDNSRRQQRAKFDASPGPHRVLVKFAAAAAPLRVAFVPAPAEPVPVVLAGRTSAQELTYLLAAGNYAAADYEAATKQIEALPVAATSAALQFFLAQSYGSKAGDSSESLAAWDRVRTLAPGALAADEALAQGALASGSFATAFRLSSRVLAARPNDSEALAIATKSWQPNATAALNEEVTWSARVAAHPSCATLRQALNFYGQRGETSQALAAEEKLNGCAPESLDYAKTLSGQGRHAEAARALQALLAAAPLNREARLMLVAELQMNGEDVAARHAAAEWLRYAPNSDRYHRLAAAAQAGPGAEFQVDRTAAAFYEPYRRDAADLAHDTASTIAFAKSVVLLDDHVAISRPDGSVSLYVHNVTRLASTAAAQHQAKTSLPAGAEVLTLRVLHPDGSSSGVGRDAAAGLSAGDALDQEYVVHYAGDGGISEHCEVFQFVFGSFGQQVLHSRFIVLTPAERADRGVVIATGGTPQMISSINGSMLQRMWSTDVTETAHSASAEGAEGLPIIRVVEEENGWSVPSNAERQRRIETIHRGLRTVDS